MSNTLERGRYGKGTRTREGCNIQGITITVAVEPGIVDPYYNSIDHSERHSKAEIRVLGAISL